MNSDLSYASQPQAEVPAVEPKPKNHFSRVFGVLFSPGETFQEIGRAPRVVIPILLVGLLTGLMSFVVVNRYGQENALRKQMEPTMKAMGVPEEQVEKAIQQELASAGTTWGKIKGPIYSVITFAVILLIVAGVFKLFTMMMGATNRFKPVLSVIAYAYLAISLIQVGLVAISVYLQNPEEIDLMNPVSSNLGGLLKVAGVELPKFISALMSFVDVFGIWRIILLGIGCATVTSKMKSATASIPHIILYFIVALMMSAIASMFG
jgi:hypothetical protein